MNIEIINRNKEIGNKKQRRGFTLVEIIVSLAIFSVVATVALGALIKIVSANRKAQSLQAAITNLNFALESVSREMRVGTKYFCEEDYNSSVPGNEITAPEGCPGISSAGNGEDGAFIAFNSSRRDTASPQGPCNLITAYRFKPNATGFSFEKGEQQGCKDPINPSADFSPVTDPAVSITGFSLKFTGDRYPLGIIRISGYAGDKERERTYFDVQTAISARVP
jgi:prepilin-type N-terminal cleavage/methylation domain-containing protein